LTSDVSTEPAQAAPAREATRPRRVTTYLAELFPQSERVPIGPRKVVVAVLAVAVGTVVSLARTTGTGPFQSIWEEDARDLLTQALMRPGAFNLVKPFVGYFQLLPRLMGEVAAFVPISWAAAALSLQAAVSTALLALCVYVASGAHLRHPLPRLLVSAPLLFAPTAENFLSEIYNRPVCLQFFLVYAVFWLLLWVPARRSGRLVMAGIVGLTAVSTFLVVICIPIALLRLYVRRDRWSLAMAAFLVGGALIQVMGLYLGLTNRAFVEPRYEPLWSLVAFFLWAVPHSILGWRFTGLSVGDTVTASSVVPQVVTYLVIAAVVVVGIRWIRRPRWVLAVVAALHSVAFCSMTIMSNGGITQRYLLTVEMFLFTALVAMLTPGPSQPAAVDADAVPAPGGATDTAPVGSAVATPRARTRMPALAPLAVLAVFVVVVSAFSYRWDNTFRHRSPHWGTQVDRAAAACKQPGMREVVIRSGPEPYYSLVTVPCHVLKRDNWCQEPYCRLIGAPVDVAAPPRRETGTGEASGRSAGAGG